jgi:hypothetical protein
LRDPREQCPQAEYDENITLVAGRCDAQRNRRHQADPGVDLQQLARRALLPARVDQGSHDVDYRIENQQDANARGQRVGRDREDHGPHDGH